MKVEPRGKYAGVKVHLDGDEAKFLMEAFEAHSNDAKLQGIPKFGIFALKMGKKVRELLAEEPKLLEDRTDAEVAAILAKEAEKASLQLNAIKSGKKWQNIPKEDLESALLKHAK